MPVGLVAISFTFFLLISTLFILRLRFIHSQYFNRWIFGVFITLFFFIIGNTLSNSRIEIFSPSHFSKSIHLDKKPQAYLAIIASEPEIKPNSLKAVVEITQIKIDDKWQSSTGKCLVYLKNNEGISLKYGDEINFLKTPTSIDPPANFDEFDYKNYLAHHYIYHRLYLAAPDFKIIGFHPLWYVKEKAITWRNYLLARYQKYGIEGAELAILSALSLGKKESLTPDLKSAYSSAGAMHVLAVSGLHVGIIFFVLQFILGWMDKIKNGKVLKAIVMIIAIWLYAFLTGLSPSVIRAATMFTFMIVALSFQRTSNIYNTLALSAFAILLYEPFMLLEVGFQLSYLAVIGIIFLHPYLYELVEIPPGLLDKAWNITCVSLAAQLVTAPLGILYFHQFPTYFLFSNLIVIPAAFLIIFMAIAFQILSVLPYVGFIIAFLLKWVIWALNWLVQGMQQLPHSLISGLDITVIETWFMYLIIVFTTIWLTQYNRKFMIYSLGVILLLAASQTIEKYNQLNQREITFYHTGKETYLEFVKGTSSSIIANPSLISNTDKMQFYVYHHRWKRGLPSEHLGLDTLNTDGLNLYVLGNTSILEVDNQHLFSLPQVENLSPDILYFNTYKHNYISQLATLNYAPKIIIGVACSKKTSEKLTQLCLMKNWEYYSIRQDGAVKIALNEYLKPLSFTPQKHH
tara:strand:+ start:15267 stop:17327 length:2061 start_codon:yes stop_codon:yes gene_type:complete